MDGRGGCCIARNGGGVYDMSSKVDRIMLRFRPIAPKPVAGGSVTSPEKADANVKTGRGKRRCARDSNSSSKRYNRKRKASPEEKVVTLPLLPEKPDRKETPASGSPPLKTMEMEEVLEGPEWLSFDVNDSDNSNNNNDKKKKMGCGLGFGGVSDRTVVISPGVKVVGSCVVVECVTDTWVGVGGDHVLGSTDVERKWSLERDTCPGFVSDGMGRVTWTNGAYRKMVVGQGEEGNGGFSSKDQVMMTVLLVMKEEEVERVRMITYPAFTCRVRLLQYTCGKERGSLTLPCDVWRLDGGGFAWRLDVKAALSLGR